MKNITAYIAFGAGVACGVAAIFTDLLLLVGLGIGVCVGAGLLVSNNFKKKNIILRIQKQKANVAENMRKLFSDYRKMKEIYQEFDNVSGKITTELIKL